MYRYETHLHTAPVSRCARSSVGESLEFYKNLGYDGVFITNHFLDGNLNYDRQKPYSERIEFYFSDYEKALELGQKIGIKVFLGVELSYKGADFLVFGLDKAWYLNHPEIMEMTKSQELALMRECGALIIQAHPFRDIDHIQLYPRYIDGIEVINASRKPGENEMARIFAEHYELLKIAGSDNHTGSDRNVLAGIFTNEPIVSVEDFINKVKNHQTEIFTFINSEKENS